ncbi:MAG: YcxB family protein [Acetanaerobacterium sp.]
MDETRELQKGDFSPALVRASYTLSEAEIRSAVKTTYIRRSLVIRIVQSAALIIIFLMYLQAVIVEPSYTTGVVMAVISLLVLAAVWAVPLFQANASTKRSVNDRFAYELEFYDKAIVVQESERSASRVAYEDSHLLDSRDFFILLVSRGTGLYCVPKRVLNEEEQETLAKHLYKRCAKATKI